MADDDPLTKFTNKHSSQPRASSASAPLPRPALPPELVRHEADGREPYEAFDNRVRVPSIEIRNFRTERIHVVQYAHMSPIDAGMRGDFLTFEAGGYGFHFEGRNLRDPLLALKLGTCGFLQDYHPAFFILPQPPDPGAAFIGRIDVVALRKPPVAGAIAPPDNPQTPR